MQQPPRKPTLTSLEVTAARKAKEKLSPTVTFTESELDRLLSAEAVDQEIKRMAGKDLLPSLLQLSKVLADIPEAFRWQENKEEELHQLKVGDTSNSKLWVQDLIEDFITYGLSPANTPEEAKILLNSLDKELEVHSMSGFGPEARNYIENLRKELELLVEKL